MMITAEERLMYRVMKAIYDSGIPVSFKGSMVLKACLLEAGYTEETRHTVDIDANWNSDTPPSGDQMVESLQKANVLKLNEDELPLLISLLSLSTDFVEAIAELIARFSLKYVIFTQGAVRSGIYDVSGEVSSINTPKVEVADTVGAGDSFTATFVVNILRGTSVAESHRKAVDVSAYTCTQRGAINPLPDSKK